MKNILLVLIIAVCSSSSLFASDDDKAYEDFYKRLLAEEPYIGYFAAEEKFISELTDGYLAARRAFFIEISRCEEDTEGFIETFIEYSKSNHLLKEGVEKDWEKVLSIMSYVLYANKPIFEFSTDNIIEYRSLQFAEYPNKKLELDLFIPKEPMYEPMPVVVCIHGGAWHVNTRVWFEPFAQYLASKGIAAVTIDYRMLPAVTFMEAVYDSKAAVRWVRANAEKYNFDPNKIGALGASAGAHLAGVLATTSDIPELEGDGGNPGVSSEIQVMAGIATPAFIITEESKDYIWLGISAEQMKLASPYENVSENSAPLYMVHGTEDRTVDPKNPQALYDKYKEMGVEVELDWIQGQGHGFYEGTDIAIKMAADFFLRYFSK